MTRIHRLLVLVLMFSPPVCFLLYTNYGLQINYQSIDIYVIFTAYVFSIFTLSGKKSVFYYVPTLFLIVQLVFSVYNPLNIDHSLVEVFGQCLKQVSPFIFLFIVAEKGALNDLRELLKKLALIISGVNILCFYLLVTGQSRPLLSYAKFLGLTNYEDDLGSYFVRPVGYFFDYHSQVLLPLIALVVIKREEKYFLFKVLILVVSVAVSGIKTAYLILAIVLVLYLLKTYSASRLLTFMPFLLALLFLINGVLQNYIFLIFYRIFTHDIEIILFHLMKVPYLLISEYPLILIFGGQTWMENYIYSEVYLVTLLFYFGIFRLAVFLSPFLLAFRYSKKDVVLGSSIILLSLGHYYIFRNGVNILGSTWVIASVMHNIKKKKLVW